MTSDTMTLVDTIFGKFLRSSKKRIDLAYDYEETELKVFGDLCRILNVDTVVDVGANIGVYSVMAKSIASVRSVYAIEASPLTYGELSQNLSNADGGASHEAFNFAASSSCGQLSFIEFGPMAGHNSVEATSFVPAREGSRTITIEARQLDELLTIPDGIVGIKVDVEGHELDALDGFQETLSRTVGFLQIEIVVKDNIDKVKFKLKELGYHYAFYLKNDFYFIHEDLADKLEACQAALFDRMAVALTDLMEMRRLRRQATRLLRGPADEIIPRVSRLLRYRRDPVMRIGM